MQAEQIMRSSLNDIVFEGRNKNYGAYVLRRVYEKHLMRAMIVAFIAFLLALFAPRIIEALTPEEKVDVNEKVVKYNELAPPPPIDKNTPPPPEIKIPEVKQMKFTPPKIVKDEEVKEEVPTIQELKEAPVITSGPSTEGTTVELPTEPIVNQVIEEKKDEIFTVVEQLPEFPGGPEALARFIQKNLNYPEQAIQAGIEGKVYVSFILSKEGEASNVTLVKGIHPACDAEAVRVVKLMKGWTPARQGGRPVTYRYIQQIKFKLQ